MISLNLFSSQLIREVFFSCLILKSSAFHFKNPANQDSHHVFNQDFELVSQLPNLNEKCGLKEKYKNDFTIGKDGIPVCKAGRKMNHDGVEIAKARIKFRCPLASRKYGCSCDSLCSDSKHGRTVHLSMKDNPHLINIPPRDSEQWKKGVQCKNFSGIINQNSERLL